MSDITSLKDIIVPLIGAIPTAIVAFLVWRTDKTSKENATRLEEAKLKMELFDRRRALAKEIGEAIRFLMSKVDYRIQKDIDNYIFYYDKIISLSSDILILFGMDAFKNLHIINKMGMYIIDSMERNHKLFVQRNDDRTEGAFFCLWDKKIDRLKNKYLNDVVNLDNIFNDIMSKDIIITPPQKRKLPFPTLSTPEILTATLVVYSVLCLCFWLLISHK